MACADARRIPLADGSVQCVVTSPPYWGRILGWFDVFEVTRNSPQVERIFRGGKRTLDAYTTGARHVQRFRSGNAPEWRPKLDSVLALCAPPFHLLEERLYYAGFQGFRYLNLPEYRKTLDAKVRI